MQDPASVRSTEVAPKRRDSRETARREAEIEARRRERARTLTPPLTERTEKPAGRPPLPQTAVGLRALALPLVAPSERIAPRLPALPPGPTAPSPREHIAQRGLLGPGQALPERARAEELLGTDLSAVVAHTDAAAAQACRALGAEAFTLGHHIAFRDPAPPLATVLHEAVHAIQQGAALAPAHELLATADPERAAEAAESLARSGPVRLSQSAARARYRVLPAQLMCRAAPMGSSELALSQEAAARIESLLDGRSPGRDKLAAALEVLAELSSEKAVEEAAWELSPAVRSALFEHLAPIHLERFPHAVLRLLGMADKGLLAKLRTPLLLALDLKRHAQAVPERLPALIHELIPLLFQRGVAEKNPQQIYTWLTELLQPEKAQEEVRALDEQDKLAPWLERIGQDFLFADSARIEQSGRLLAARQPAVNRSHVEKLARREKKEGIAVAFLGFHIVRALPESDRAEFLSADKGKLWGALRSAMSFAQLQAPSTSFYKADVATTTKLRLRISTDEVWKDPSDGLLGNLMSMLVAAGEHRWLFDLSRTREAYRSHPRLVEEFQLYEPHQRPAYQPLQVAKQVHDPSLITGGLGLVFLAKGWVDLEKVEKIFGSHMLGVRFLPRTEHGDRLRPGEPPVYAADVNRLYTVLSPTLGRIQARGPLIALEGVEMFLGQSKLRIGRSALSQVSLDLQTPTKQEPQRFMLRMTLGELALGRITLQGPDSIMAISRFTAKPFDLEVGQPEEVLGAEPTRRLAEPGWMRFTLANLLPLIRANSAGRGLFQVLGSLSNGLPPPAGRLSVGHMEIQDITLSSGDSLRGVIADDLNIAGSVTPGALRRARIMSLQRIVRQLHQVSLKEPSEAAREQLASRIHELLQRITQSTQELARIETDEQRLLALYEIHRQNQRQPYYEDKGGKVLRILTVDYRGHAPPGLNDEQKTEYARIIDRLRAAREAGGAIVDVGSLRLLGGQLGSLSFKEAGATSLYAEAETPGLDLGSVLSPVVDALKKSAGEESKTMLARFGPGARARFEAETLSATELRIGEGEAQKGVGQLGIKGLSVDADDRGSAALALRELEATQIFDSKRRVKRFFAKKLRVGAEFKGGLLGVATNFKEALESGKLHGDQLGIEGVDIAGRGRVLDGLQVDMLDTTAGRTSNGWQARLGAERISLRGLSLGTSVRLLREQRDQLRALKKRSPAEAKEYAKVKKTLHEYQEISATIAAATAALRRAPQLRDAQERLQGAQRALELWRQDLQLTLVGVSLKATVIGDLLSGDESALQSIKLTGEGGRNNNQIVRQATLAIGETEVRLKGIGATVVRTGSVYAFKDVGFASLSLPRLHFETASLGLHIRRPVTVKDATISGVYDPRPGGEFKLSKVWIRAIEAQDLTVRYRRSAGPGAYKETEASLTHALIGGLRIEDLNLKKWTGRARLQRVDLDGIDVTDGQKIAEEGEAALHVATELHGRSMGLDLLGPRGWTLHLGHTDVGPTGVEKGETAAELSVQGLEGAIGKNGQGFFLDRVKLAQLRVDKVHYGAEADGVRSTFDLGKGTELRGLRLERMQTLMGPSSADPKKEEVKRVAIRNLKIDSIVAGEARYESSALECGPNKPAGTTVFYFSSAYLQDFHLDDLTVDMEHEIREEPHGPARREDPLDQVGAVCRAARRAIGKKMDARLRAKQFSRDGKTWIGMEGEARVGELGVYGLSLTQTKPDGSQTKISAVEIRQRDVHAGITGDRKLQITTGEDSTSLTGLDITHDGKTYHLDQGTLSKLVLNMELGPGINKLSGELGAIGFKGLQLGLKLKDEDLLLNRERFMQKRILPQLQGLSIDEQSVVLAQWEDFFSGRGRPKSSKLTLDVLRHTSGTLRVVAVVKGRKVHIAVPIQDGKVNPADIAVGNISFARALRTALAVAVMALLRNPNAFVAVAASEALSFDPEFLKIELERLVQFALPPDTESARGWGPTDLSFLSVSADLKIGAGRVGFESGPTKASIDLTGQSGDSADNQLSVRGNVAKNLEISGPRLAGKNVAVEFNGGGLKAQTASLEGVRVVLKGVGTEELIIDLAVQDGRITNLKFSVDLSPSAAPSAAPAEPLSTQAPGATSSGGAAASPVPTTAGPIPSAQAAAAQTLAQYASKEQDATIKHLLTAPEESLARASLSERSRWIYSLMTIDHANEAVVAATWRLFAILKARGALRDALFVAITEYGTIRALVNRARVCLAQVSKKFLPNWGLREYAFLAEAEAVVAVAGAVGYHDVKQWLYGQSKKDLAALSSVERWHLVSGLCLSKGQSLDRDDLMHAHQLMIGADISTRDRFIRQMQNQAAIQNPLKPETQYLLISILAGNATPHDHGARGGLKFDIRTTGAAQALPLGYKADDPASLAFLRTRDELRAMDSEQRALILVKLVKRGRSAGRSDVMDATLKVLESAADPREQDELLTRVHLVLLSTLQRNVLAEVYPQYVFLNNLTTIRSWFVAATDSDISNLSFYHMIRVFNQAFIALQNKKAHNEIDMKILYRVFAACSANERSVIVDSYRSKLDLANDPVHQDIHRILTGTLRFIGGQRQQDEESSQELKRAAGIQSYVQRLVKLGNTSPATASQVSEMSGILKAIGNDEDVLCEVLARAYLHLEPRSVVYELTRQQNILLPYGLEKVRQDLRAADADTLRALSPYLKLHILSVLRAYATTEEDVELAYKLLSCFGTADKDIALRELGPRSGFVGSVLLAVGSKAARIDHFLKSLAR